LKALMEAGIEPRRLLKGSSMTLTNPYSLNKIAMSLQFS
jgi:hypothetical protein